MPIAPTHIARCAGDGKQRIARSPWLGKGLMRHSLPGLIWRNAPAHGFVERR